MELTRQQKLRFGLISALILAVLVTQIYTGFRKGYKWWPFLAYPMYAEAHFENERIGVENYMYAVTPKGRIYLHPDRDLHLGFWRYDGVARGLRDGKLKQNSGALALIRSVHPDIERLEIEDYPVIITRDGPKPAPKKIVATINRATIDEWAK